MQSLEKEAILAVRLNWDKIVGLRCYFPEIILPREQTTNQTNKQNKTTNQF